MTIRSTAHKNISTQRMKERRNGVLRRFQQLRSYRDETETPEPGGNSLLFAISSKGVFQLHKDHRQSSTMPRIYIASRPTRLGILRMSTQRSVARFIASGLQYRQSSTSQPDVCQCLVVQLPMDNLSKNKSGTSITDVGCKSNLCSIVRSSMHLCLGNWVAMGCAVMF